jgi:putative DNA methylase
MAIKGSGDDFRLGMVNAYRAMAKLMPDTGLQIVTFTHQDGTVWSDMAQIFWASGLQVTAAWYVATETSSGIRDGGYVQGTVILVLRKRTAEIEIYKDELVQEIATEVAQQIERLIGLDQQVRGAGRSANLFNDADLQMAGFAAAMQVLTAYTVIDGVEMTREALRPRSKGEKTLVDEIVELAVQIANEHLVPDGLDGHLWRLLRKPERFYLKLLELESEGYRKLENYQNLGKAFKLPDIYPLMGNKAPNAARLKTAPEIRQTTTGQFGTTGFNGGLLHGILLAIAELLKDVDGELILRQLADNVPGYYDERPRIMALATWLSRKLEAVRPQEAKQARILEQLVRNQKL